MSSLAIRPVSAAADEQAWDQFVWSQKLGTPYHLNAWRRVCSETFHYKCHSLMVWRGGQVEAVLPLFLVSNPITGRILLSSPFAVYGGILSSNEEAATALRARAAELGRQLHVQYVEFRNLDQTQCAGWPRVTRYVTFLKQLETTETEILKALPRETRRMTRRAIEQNYDIRFTRDLSQFEPLYTANLRKLGTPAFPLNHFRTILDAYPSADVMELRLDGKVVAAVLSLYHGQTVLPYYGASDPDFNRANPNNMMYFALMREALARGLSTFDFGRSKTATGAYMFKSHWGMEEHQLPYEILLVRRKQLPNFSPANPKFDLAIRAWRRLPLPVTRIIGPWLIRLFP